MSSVGSVVAQEWRNHWNTVAEQTQNNALFDTVSVSSPTTVGTLLSKYVVYNVKSEPSGYSVRRRYNDFVWLRDMLVASYPGMFIPALPAANKVNFSSKSVGGSKVDVDSDFVKNRMAQLHLFLQQLKNIPFIVNSDPSLNAFLLIQNDKDFLSYQESSKKKEKEESSGARLWEELILKVVAPGDVARLVADVRRQMEVLKSTLTQIEDTVYNCGKSCTQFAKQVKYLSNFINNWNAKETELAGSTMYECPNGYGAIAKYWTDGLVQAMSHYSVSTTLNPKMFAVVLLANIQFQLVQIEGFSAHLMSYEQSILELEKAERAKMQAFEEKVNGTSKSRGFGGFFGGDVDEVYAKKEKIVENCAKKVDMIAKGLAFSEIDRFNLERSQNTEKIVGSFISVNLTAAQQNLADWIGTAGALNVNALNFQHNTSLVFAANEADIGFAGDE